MGRHKQFVPDDVVDCVMDVFWNNGYAATSPRALADAAGIGVSSLYNAFGSKHDLFLRVLRRYAANELAHQIRLLDEPGPVRDPAASAVAVLATVSGLGVLAGMDAWPERVDTVIRTTVANL
jgi:TetR/AcrR family transcriptional repressor of nem operon